MKSLVSICLDKIAEIEIKVCSTKNRNSKLKLKARLGCIKLSMNFRTHSYFDSMNFFEFNSLILSDQLTGSIRNNASFDRKKVNFQYRSTFEVTINRPNYIDALESRIVGKHSKVCSDTLDLIIWSQKIFKILPICKGLREMELEWDSEQYDYMSSMCMITDTQNVYWRLDINISLINSVYVISVGKTTREIAQLIKSLSREDESSFGDRHCLYVTLSANDEAKIDVPISLFLPELRRVFEEIRGILKIIKAAK